MVKVEVEVDPRRLALEAGAMTFHVKEGHIDGKRVPSSFALLAMVDERALTFYDKLRAADLRPEEEWRLMEEAVEKGVEAAEKKLEEYIAKRPEKGKVTLLRYSDATGTGLVITDGVTFLRLPVDHEAAEIVAKLPKNVYGKAKRVESFRRNKRVGTSWLLISREWLLKIMESPEDFFNFVVRVRRLENGVLNRASGGEVRKYLQSVCRLYFEGRELAVEWLAKYEEAEKLARIGEKIVSQLEKSAEQYIEYGGGYFLYIDNTYDVFYVTDDGGVLFLGGMRAFDKARLYIEVGRVASKLKAGEPIQESEEVAGWMLREVAKVISKVRPDLVPIILP